MHPKEREIREVATKAPFIPFTLVTASGERYKVPTPDHISYFPEMARTVSCRPRKKELSALSCLEKAPGSAFSFSTRSPLSISVAPRIPLAGSRLTLAAQPFFKNLLGLAIRLSPTRVNLNDVAAPGPYAPPIAEGSLARDGLLLGRSTC